MKVDFDPYQPLSTGIIVSPLNRDLMFSLNRYLEAGGRLEPILRVTVVQTLAQGVDVQPDVLGRYRVSEESILFTPLFPFEPGMVYRASFEFRLLGCPIYSVLPTLEFSLPREPNGPPARVTQIFPSGDYLPENLLRLYVCFSRPMQRGFVDSEISLLGPDGEPASDVLYRAPVELWDKSMQCLTILLDPGRLKRGVGPNRELGPPLQSGLAYTLSVGAGMTDLPGNKLPEAVYKRFHVTHAVRNAIAIQRWIIIPPLAESSQPLLISFPEPLDWAMLRNSVTVVRECGHPLPGSIGIDHYEMRWSFVPASPWAAGPYNVRIASDLEDVCGNNVIAAFDRPLRSGNALTSAPDSHCISFLVR